jgi:hypothetical protein
MLIDWQALLAFVASRDAELAASLRGVPREDIEAVEKEYSIRLPASYVDFLLVMGEDSGGLEPLGPTQDHTFSEVRDLLPPEGYPDRFFKVAFESDSLALADLDSFLDLARSDGEDAPLVTFETGEEDDPAVPETAASDWTFGETVTERIFSRLELDRRAATAKVFVMTRDPADALVVKRDSIAALAGHGLQPALPELPRVACLTGDALSAVVDVHDETKLVSIRLGADDRRTLEPLAEFLLANLRDATLMQAPAERRERSGV